MMWLHLGRYSLFKGEYMKFYIKSEPKLMVDLKLDIPELLHKNMILTGYDDYFKYFSEQHFHICNFKSLKFSDDAAEGSNADLNKFIWMAMAHQAYMERKFLLKKEYVEELELAISSIFHKDLEAVEWFMAIHRSIDLYLKSNVSSSIEFLPANIVPLTEITNFLNQIENTTASGVVEDYEVSTVIYS